MSTHFTTAASEAADDGTATKRRRRALLVGGLIAGGGVVAAIVAPVSAHAGAHQAQPVKTTVSSTSDVSPQYSRGFHIYNLSSYRMKLLSITGDGNFEGRPNDGDVLMPGVGFHDIEVQ